jgi:hypothetical protein
VSQVLLGRFACTYEPDTPMIVRPLPSVVLPPQDELGLIGAERASHASS